MVVKLPNKCELHFIGITPRLAGLQTVQIGPKITAFIQSYVDVGQQGTN